MRELGTLFMVIGAVTGMILLLYWRMGRKAKPKKTKGWREPDIK